MIFFQIVTSFKKFVFVKINVFELFFFEFELSVFE